MVKQLEVDCQSIDGSDFDWAVGAVAFRWMTFLSFAALKSILLISG